MRALWLWISCCVLVAVLAACASLTPASAAQQPRPVVLVLVGSLSWEDVEQEQALRDAFGEGAAATLSTTQGSTLPDDPRFGYVLLGAGSRVDSRFLPARLPGDPAQIPGVFDGPASTVHPGSLGDALQEAGVKAAAVGFMARLVVMDSDGDVPNSYPGTDPVADLQTALDEGARLVAVQATDPRQAAGLVEAARGEGAAVAVAGLNGPPEVPKLAPFALVQPGAEGGLLYSPATRTVGLLTNADVAPTLLDVLSVPAPPEMSGRAAEVRPGEVESAELLQRRIWLVEEDGFMVWAVVGALWAAALVVGVLRAGRRGASAAVLALAGLPAGALLAAAVPVTDALVVGALTAVIAGGISALFRRLSGSFYGALAWMGLATAALVLLDAAAGGALQRFSTLGYNPASGTRFYGVGNEYAAVLAGGLTIGLGILAHRRRPPTALFALAGGIAVVVLGLPTMGADVGGSLALGLALGASLGLIRGEGWRATVLWAAGGFAFAAALFVASGALLPGVSHGSQAAGGRSGLYEILVRKLEISLGYLSSPVLLLIFLVGAVAIWAGWRRARRTPLAAGIPCALVAAVASGALNDSGLVATLFALIFPLVGALGVLISKENAGLRRFL